MYKYVYLPRNLYFMKIVANLFIVLKLVRLVRYLKVLHYFIVYQYFCYILCIFGYLIII